MGGFSIPAIMPSKVLTGALGRYREYQEADEKEELGKRDRYVQHLGKLIDSAADGETVQWLTDEIARIETLPRNKPFKPRSMPPPTWAKGGQAGQQPGQAGPQGQPQPGQQQASGSATTTPASAGATPQFDLRSMLAEITGAGRGGPEAQAGAGATPAADPSMATPPPMPELGGAPAPFTGAVPQLGMQQAAPVQAAPTASTTPTAVMPLPTPGGRSTPEATPLTGTVPGTASGMATGMVPSEPQGGGITPGSPAGPPVGQLAGPAGPVGPSATPEPLFLGNSRFMGLAERAELPYLLNQHYGMTKSGKQITPGAKPLVSVKDLVAAASKGYGIEQVPVSDEYPLGFAVVPREMSNLSELDKAKVRLSDMRGASVQVRDKIADMRLEIERDRVALGADRNAIARERNQIQRERASEVANRFDVNTTIKVGQNYKKSIEFWREAKLNLASVEARLDQATGPADYMAILETVHSIDDTAAREGEVATYRGAAAVTDRVEQIMTRATEGDLLNGTTREQMRAALRAGIKAMEPVKQEIDQQYGVMADDWMLDRAKIGLPGASATPRGDSASTSARTPARTPASSRPAPAGDTTERWERDPATGKLRRVQ